jgi:hypothetical protein
MVSRDMRPGVAEENQGEGADTGTATAVPYLLSLRQKQPILSPSTTDLARGGFKALTPLSV